MNESRQGELPIRYPADAGELPLLPARMVNEYQYCPRLAYLEWVQGEWADSGDTVEGRHAHRRVDVSTGRLPEPESDGTARLHARSVTLSSMRLGLIARMDLVEAEGAAVTPVDYKRGKRPHVPRGAYDPERVQLCIQGMILEEHGYSCSEGVLYFVGSRERVRVVFDDELRTLTLAAVDGLRLAAAGGQAPPPLRDSPKCPRCSLVDICLPDEVNFLREADSPPRPLSVSREERLPLYVQANGARIAKKGETLEITTDEENTTFARLPELSQIVLMGNIHVTTPTLHELMRRGIPVTWYSYGGWFLGHTVGTGHRNVELRTAQYRASFDERACLHVARELVRVKILNCRTLLRRNWRGQESSDRVVALLKRDAEAASRAPDVGTLLGVEGAAASRYFGAFVQMIKRTDDADTLRFDFTRRNRRPPTDPVNALLSFSYALLVRAFSVTLTAVGFDAYRGLFHKPRYGRPALSLDIMEPFRPLLADSSVLTAINNGEVRPGDFVRSSGSVALTPGGRKRFIAAFERRMSQEVTHPVFGYRASYRRVLQIEVRLLGRYLLGELPVFSGFLTR